MDLQKLLESSRQSPKKILKIVIAVSIVMLVMWLFMVSRMELNETSRPADSESVERTESLRTAITRDGQESGGPDRQAPNIFMNALTTFVIMVVILVIVLIWVRSRQGKTPQRHLKEVGQHLLGQGAQIKIIEMNEEIWVLGVTNANVNLLHRYDKKNWKEKIETAEVPEKSFYDLFKSKS